MASLVFGVVGSALGPSLFGSGFSILGATVTGVEVNREGDGVSYVSLGFPGATVQLLQKLAEDNLAADLKRVAPDVIVHYLRIRRRLSPLCFSSRS